MPRLSVPGITLGTLLKTLGIVSLIGILLFYVLFQARNFINGPVIEIRDTYTPLTHERVIPLVGVARNIVKLTLNGQEITTDKNGNFSEMVVLPEGYSVVSIVAFDRFGRTTDVAREYVYVPNTTSPAVVE